MLRDYEELICDIRDGALFECAEEFSSALLKANTLDLTETFRKYVWERLEKLREYPDEDNEETPVDDIERVLGQCKKKFSEVIDSVAEEALFAAEMAFRAKIDRSIVNELQEVIDKELYS